MTPEPDIVSEAAALHAFMLYFAGKEGLKDPASLAEAVVNRARQEKDAFMGLKCLPEGYWVMVLQEWSMWNRAWCALATLVRRERVNRQERDQEERRDRENLLVGIHGLCTAEDVSGVQPLGDPVFDAVLSIRRAADLYASHVAMTRLKVDVRPPRTILTETVPTTKPLDTKTGGRLG